MSDLWVVDEALELDDTAQSSFLPLLSASKNPQTLYLSSPPDEKSDGEVFRRIRETAISGSSTSTSWNEWGVEEIGDVANRERWARVIPSLGYLIKESTVEGELEQMAPDKFARERLGWWSSRSAKAVIGSDEWNACRNDDPPTEGAVTYAVKCAPDNSTMTIAACRKPADGNPHVEVIVTLSTSDGLTQTAYDLAQRAGIAAAIVIDGQGTAQALNDKLLALKVSKKVIVRPTSSDVAAACSTLLNAVNEGAVTHYGQRELDAAAACSKRPIGSKGGWGFAGDGAELIEAVALAHWGAINTKRDPSRKQRVL